MSNDLAPGVDKSLQVAAGLRRVNESEAWAAVGLSRSGVLLPYYRAGAPLMVNGKPYARLRLDDALPGGQKYMSPRGSGVQIYEPPGFDPSRGGGVVYLIEGEKKCLALASAGFSALGLGGICGWSGPRPEGGDRPLHSDLTAAVEGRKVYYCGDSDTGLIYDFAREAVALARALGRDVYLPRYGYGVAKGVDDVRAVKGAEFGPWFKGLPVVRVGGGRDPAAVAAELAKSCAESSTLSLDDRPEVTRRLAKLLPKLSPLDAGGVLEAWSRALNVKTTALVKAVQAEARAIAARDEAARDELAAKKSAELLDGRESWGPLWAVYQWSKNGELTARPSERWIAAAISAAEHVLYDPNDCGLYHYDHLRGVWCKMCEAEQIKWVGARYMDQLADLEASEYIDDVERAAAARHVEVRFLRPLLLQLTGAALKVEPWGARPVNLVHCPSACWRVESGGVTRVNHSPDNMSRVCGAYDYDPLPPVMWLEFLAGALNPDDVDLLQIWFGAAVLGVNAWQKLLILRGCALSGKSTISEVARLLVGSAGVCGLRTAYLDDRFELGRYIGRSLLIGADVPPDFLSARGARALKSLIGGDPLTAELKGVNSTVHLTGSLNILVTTNNRLTVRVDGSDDVSAWARRVLVIDFPRPLSVKVAPNWSASLMAAEGARVMGWAVEGARRLLNALDGGGWTLTADQVARVDDLLGESRGVTNWAAENILRAEGYNLTISDALEAYSSYAAARGWAAKSSRLLSTELINAVQSIHGRPVSNSVDRGGVDARGWRGLTLA